MTSSSSSNANDELRSWHDSTLPNGVSLGVCYCREDVGRYFGLRLLSGIGHAVSDRMIVIFVQSITDDKIEYTFFGFPSRAMRKVDGTPLAFTPKKNPMPLSQHYIARWVEALPSEIKENIQSTQIQYKTRRASKPPY